MEKVDFAKFVKFLEKAEDDGFFGEIVFKYRNGDIFMITKLETLKPDDL